MLNALYHFTQFYQQPFHVGTIFKDGEVEARSIINPPYIFGDSPVHLFIGSTYAKALF